MNKLYQISFFFIFNFRYYTLFCEVYMAEFRCVITEQWKKYVFRKAEIRLASMFFMAHSKIIFKQEKSNIYVFIVHIFVFLPLLVISACSFCSNSFKYYLVKYFPSIWTLTQQIEYTMVRRSKYLDVNILCCVNFSKGSVRYRVTQLTYLNQAECDQY